MIKSFLLLLLFFIASFANAQKSTAWYNHTLLDVRNLESSVAFYTKVFQADTIPYPFPPSPQYIVKWLRVGEGIELHLSQWVNDTTKVISDAPSAPEYVGFVHFGFMVISMDAFLKRLMEVSSDYKSGKYKQPIIDRMPYGAKTIMIKDPDGNEIHVIEAMPANSKNDEELIRAARQTSNQAIARQDIDGISKFWLDDYVVIRGSGVVRQGKEANKANWTENI